MAETFEIIDTQEKLEAVLKARLDREKKAHSEAIAGLQATINTLTTENKGLKTAAETNATLDSENKELRGKVTKYETDSGKRDIAEEYGLPAGFYTRLQGANQDEWRTDAAALAQIVAANRQLAPPLATGDNSPADNATTAAYKKMINMDKGD